MLPEPTEKTLTILETLHGNARFQKAQKIAGTPGAVKHVKYLHNVHWDLWKVASDKKADYFYEVVARPNDIYQCNCYDFKQRFLICKHIFAVILKEMEEKLAKAEAYTRIES